MSKEKTFWNSLPEDLATEHKITACNKSIEKQRERITNLEKKNTRLGNKIGEGKDLLSRCNTHIIGLEIQMLLLAKLSADTPQFNSPLEVVSVKELRDKILKEAGL